MSRYIERWIRFHAGPCDMVRLRRHTSISASNGGTDWNIKDSTEIKFRFFFSRWQDRRPDLFIPTTIPESSTAATHPPCCSTRRDSANLRPVMVIRSKSRARPEHQRQSQNGLTVRAWGIPCQNYGFGDRRANCYQPRSNELDGL